MTIAHDHRCPDLDLERSLPSEVTAISPFVDKLMLLIRKCRCVPGGETDVEIALREALANAIIHGNHEDPRKHVHVSCRCEPDEVSIAVRDEGQGFDVNKVPDPTAPENMGSVRGRGIHVMEALMDEVRFEEGGAVVHMRKSADRSRSNKMTTKEKYMGKLEGKIALITGGNSGIGLATAKQFVNEGAYVFVTGAVIRSWLRRQGRSEEM